MNTTRQDVIVIGGGIAGLTAAAYIARAGRSVTVLEQNEVPGGYVSSFCRQGYTFPAGLTSFCSNGIVFPILRELGLDQKRSFSRTYRQVSWEGNDIPLREIPAVERQFAQVFPEEATNLSRYFQLVRESMRWAQAFERHNLYLEPRPINMVAALLPLPVRAPHFLWKLLTSKGSTNRSLHAELFQDARLRALFDQMGYPVMPFMNTMGMWASYLQDYWFPLSGMQSFANTFLRYIHDRGGNVCLATRVQRILLDRERAVGVELEDGRTILADAVLSTADFRSTYLKLVGREHLSPAFLQKLETGVPSESVFTVYLGVKPNDERAFCRFKESHVLYFSRSGELIQLIWLDKDDTTLAPRGRHALCISRFSLYSDWQEWKGIRNASYQARKAAEVRRLIELAEEFVPGLGEMIEVCDAASPLTYERYTGNDQGSTVGWNWDPARNPGFAGKDLPPIDNLFVAGHWYFRLGGMVSAMITARYQALALCSTDDRT